MREYALGYPENYIPSESPSIFGERLHQVEKVPEILETYIWGTKISINEVSNKFRNFINSFELPPLYPQLISEVLEDELNVIPIDCTHIESFDSELLSFLIQYPQDILPIFDLVLSEFGELKSRPFNILQLRAIRSLSPILIDTIVSLRGMVTRITSIIPELQEAFFECTECGNSEKRFVSRGRVDEPHTCTSCGMRLTMALISNRSIFADKQIVKLQEDPESVPEGDTPHTINLYVYDDLVESVRPGDRIEVTGIFRASPIRVSSIQRRVWSVYRTYVDVLHIVRFVEIEEIPNIEKCRELASDPFIYERIIKSLAPSIFGMEDIKKGILCQLFGGSNSTTSLNRGEINILLCGDPGTSKSQLLKYVNQLSPRGIYTSGKGTSAVGLTAYVTKDPDTKEFILESGALVLSDGGICCIDEFDKMSDQTRSILHEVMEQQTVSVAKAGIVATLNAKTSVLAAANPVDSRYNPRISVVDNIKLPPTLISRFDLIFIVLDEPNEEIDRKLAHHIISLFFGTKINIDIPSKLLKEYISLARREVKPILTEEAGELLINKYIEMRRIGASRGTVSATPRQLESLIRLSSAHARIRFSSIVEPFDVEEAYRLVRTALLQAATDPETGMIDLDLIATGRSAAARGRIKNLSIETRKFLERNVSSETDRAIVFSNLQRNMEEQSTLKISREDLIDALRSLVEEEIIAIIGNPLRNPIIKLI